MPRLLVAVDDPQAEFRRRVVEVVGLLAARALQAIPRLLTLLRDEAAAVRHVSALTLVQMIPQLRRGLDSPDPGVRVEHARALALLETSPAIGILLRSLRAATAEQISLSVAAVTRLGDEAMPALQQALDDPDQAVRNCAVLILKQLGPVATTALCKTLKDQRAGLERLRAAQALSQVGPQGVTALIQLTGDEDRVVRLYVARGLASAGADEAVLPALRRLRADRDPLIRGAAVEALRSITAGASAASRSATSRPSTD